MVQETSGSKDWRSDQCQDQEEEQGGVLSPGPAQPPNHTRPASHKGIEGSLRVPQVSREALTTR
jgi:hypothetical protein